MSECILMCPPKEHELSALLSTAYSAGHDLKCAEDEVLIPPGTQAKVATKVRVAMPNDVVGILSHRSGMNSKQGVIAYGTIDPDYRGILYVTLFNCHPNKEVRIKKGDKIAQIIFLPLAKNPVMYCKEEYIMSLETERGEGGHGHTGK